MQWCTFCVFFAGIVVANDADSQRCNLLAHQTKRMCSPALVVTNHDATMYPIVTDHAAKVTAALSPFAMGVFSP